MNVKLLTEHHLEFLSLKGGCRGLSESTLVKMPHCKKSHVVAKLSYFSTKTLSPEVQISFHFNWVFTVLEFNCFF